jgi:hypothetical protein
METWGAAAMSDHGIKEFKELMADLDEAGWSRMTAAEKDAFLPLYRKKLAWESFKHAALVLRWPLWALVWLEALRLGIAIGGGMP